MTPRPVDADKHEQSKTRQRAHTAMIRLRSGTRRANALESQNNEKAIRTGTCSHAARL